MQSVINTLYRDNSNNNDNNNGREDYTMAKFTKKLSESMQNGHVKDIDKMNIPELRTYIVAEISGKARRKLKKVMDAMDDDDFMDNIVMEPKPEYKSTK